MLCGYAPSLFATCAAQIYTTLCGQFIIIFSCCHLRPHNGSCKRARSFGYCLSSRATVIVALSAYNQDLVFDCVMRMRSPLATCAAQIYTTLCGQYFSPIFAAVPIMGSPKSAEQTLCELSVQSDIEPSWHRSRSRLWARSRLRGVKTHNLESDLLSLSSIRSLILLKSMSLPKRA